MGFGGHGLQVRDVLHVDDLYDLIVHQLKGLKRILRAVCSMWAVVWRTAFPYVN